jgi:DEK C terminal domain
VRAPKKASQIELTDCKSQGVEPEESEDFPMKESEQEEEEVQSEEVPQPKKKRRTEVPKPAKTVKKTALEKMTTAKMTATEKTTAKRTTAKRTVSAPMVESSDDDVPLIPPDATIKSDIKSFLAGKDLSIVTKGMIKDMLRQKYGERIVKSKKAAIAEGIEEGM